MENENIEVSKLSDESDFDVTEVNDVTDAESADNISEEISSDETEEKKKVVIVGVKFKKNGKTYHFDPNGLELKADDKVMVDTSRGQEFGFITLTPREVSSGEIVAPLRSVLRLANEEEMKLHEENVRKEVEAYNACIAAIDRHGLEMKLIDAEMSFDRSKLMFYFSSEERVDFRELVKDLAATFHTRIEMRQIGIRDEAKILGGLGTCGRPFCCSSFLQDFVQVSVKMAKEQNLSLNAAKISGSCGRLMCCLRYEYDTYLEEKALTPKVDTRVMTPDGPGIITEANPLAGIVKVRLDSAPSDSAQVVYVREDVVKESEYNGEKLVKTAVPDRSRKNDLENEFMPIRTIEASDVHATAPAVQKEQAQEVKPTSEQNDKKETADAPENNSRSNGEKNDRRGKHRFDKRHHGNNSQNRPEKRKDTAEQSDKKQEQSSDQKPQQINTSAKGDTPSANNQQNHSKKKHKPYYRHFKKNKGGDNKPQQQ